MKSVFDVADVVQVLTQRFAGMDFRLAPLAECRDAARQQMCIRVEPSRLIEVMQVLRSDAQCHFDQLCDLTCVDYLEFPDATDRYGVTYSLVSTRLGHRIWVKCFVNDPEPAVPSVTGIWRGANWLEREVWDLFGVKFTGHPDLRRIVTWEGFPAHPLRKDYPLRGRGERENYKIITRESAELSVEGSRTPVMREEDT